MNGTLYIVSTPIGNLKDITLRAIEILKQVDLIACEDTRHTKILASHYDIKTPLTSYFEHNKVRKSKHLVSALKEGKDIALVSDAGTPGVSDPGYRFIKDAIDSGIAVTIAPGANALISALVLSGLPTDRFIFEGFLPAKSAARKKRLEFFKGEKRTIIFYESPHRTLASLEDMKAVFGDAHIVCARELTKKFEEIKRGTPAELIEYFSRKKPKGEFIILINPKMKSAHSK